MKKMFYLILPLFALAGCFEGADDELPEPPPVFTATQTFNVSLTGHQQVPNVVTDDIATATVELDEDLKQIRASVDLSDIDNVEAAHIHDGDLGFNGDVAFAFTADTSGVYRIAPIDISDALIADLQNGEWYINVHTTSYPNGKIRGQIVNDETVIVTFPLAGQQEVPAVDTIASGYAYAAIDQTDYQLTLTARTMGVADATMAHIHTGRVGTNGDVLVGLEAAEEDGVWVLPAETMIDEATFQVLAGGGHYVNVHTPANPGGELRGQIITDNFVLTTFALSGKQEVPMVDTPASGDGYALINTDDYMVEVVAVTTGVDDATMAHIHTGRIGNNGDVLVGLVQSGDDLGTWMTPEDTQIDEATFAILASGGHYVNVHTPENPSGELRGQILTDNFVLSTYDLSGAQEVPAVATMASGDGYALINTTNFAVELVALTEGVDDATMAHIHTGRVGINGDVLIALEQDVTTPGKWVTPDGTLIDADIFAVLASGGHYVNVHTPAYPGGELRGQILTDNYMLATFALSGAQEVPAVNTSASGTGYALVNKSQLTLELMVHTQGVDDATMAHIHTGRVGVNGDVLVPLVQVAGEAGSWLLPTATPITADILNVLMSGGHYVNVHTPANPSGELRGQIISNDNFALITFPLSGAQEVPAVTTAARGDGYAMVNLSDYSLELQVLTSGVEDATAAHIHTGVAGVNGPVLLGLEQDAGNVNRWMTPADAALTQSIFDVLAAGGHYVNVHTPEFPNGEIRGQIE
ncbi:CHRD domain-containing protein [Arsukibacterium sp. UBA3155]|uniref:CHRD domain-containing protein n=1 Tax=Arsukibacterium sp. UBA3155 TaxID=1946058 RepID=UPI0025BC125B|nr:CHRD domain-containing protein [Arsukibacterium sp. UBA3155]|tara:strand:+ start:101402 stop:103666 length:2265 start_codon:yes stop_codon:yes gene_type:complete